MLSFSDPKHDLVLLKIINNWSKTHIFFLFVKKYTKHANGVKTDAGEGISGQHSIV